MVINKMMLKRHVQQDDVETSCHSLDFSFKCFSTYFFNRKNCLLKITHSCTHIVYYLRTKFSLFSGSTAVRYE